MKATKTNQKEPELIRLLNMTKACELWGVTRYHVYDLIRDGKIRPIVGCGKGFRFLATDYKHEFLQRL